MSDAFEFKRNHMGQMKLARCLRERTKFDFILL